MSPPSEEPADQEQLGDYRLSEILSDGVRTRTYRARQISVEREVVLERIKREAQGDPGVVEHFLADVRAKAAVEHNGIGSVYEAVHDEDAVFYTREVLPGKSLEKLHEGGKTMKPARIATFLRQISAALHYLEERGVATLPLEPRHVVLGDHDVIRLVNLAVADEPDSAVPGHDRHLIAELLLDFLQRGSPGSTRARTLLNMMAGGDGEALTWRQIAHTSRKLEQDLSEGAKVASQRLRTRSMEGAAGRGVSPRVVMGALGVIILLSLVGAAGWLWSNRKPPPKARDLGAMMEIPAGTYQTHDGKEVRLERFWIDAHEVTIAEYAEFLRTLTVLSEDRRTAYDHPDQPAIKSGHIPDDWESLLTAARSGGRIEGLPVDLNYPVTNLDWWDACAFATWKGGRLPTQEEWFAASQDGPLYSQGRGPVDEFPEDVTPRGVHGLAGNVSEWVNDPALNPAFPMNPKRPICCGASYLHPRNGPKARIWLESREVRRRDVGFRMARDTAP